MADITASATSSTQMGTDVFNRIKVGIGEKPKGWDLADYVLAKFSPDDLPAMEEGMEKAVKGVELILSLRCGGGGKPL